MSAGAARVVVGCMLAFPSSDPIQLTGSGACWCLATTAENELLVVQAGGLDINRHNLERYQDNPIMLQQICGAIRNLITLDGHKELFCRSSDVDGDDGLAACRNLVRALDRHAAATALAQQASGSIAALAMHVPNKGILGDVGAIPALVHAMQLHTGSDDASAQVHEECCAALRNLAANHTGNKDAIAACGGIPAIVESMRIHRDSAINQLHAAGALWNVPANNAANKAAVAACGGIAALLGAMTHHSSDAEVQLEVIGSLRNLSTLLDNKPLILAAGALPILVATMRRFIELPLLQEQACALCFNLINMPTHVADAQASVLSLIDQDAPALLLTVLETHISSSNVVEEACAALWLLHRASPSVDWPPAFIDRVASLGERALALHANSGGVMNFAAGMKTAWTTNNQQQPTQQSTQQTPQKQTTKLSIDILQNHANNGIVSPQRATEPRS